MKVLLVFGYRHMTDFEIEYCYVQQNSIKLLSGGQAGAYTSQKYRNRNYGTMPGHDVPLNCCQTA